MWAYFNPYNPDLWRKNLTAFVQYSPGYQDGSSGLYFDNREEHNAGILTAVSVLPSSM
jgi:hypothetical protein